MPEHRREEHGSIHGRLVIAGAAALFLGVAWVLAAIGPPPDPRIPSRAVEDEILTRAVLYVVSDLEEPVFGLVARTVSDDVPSSLSMAKLGSFSQEWGLDESFRFADAIRTRGRPRVLGRHGDRWASPGVGALASTAPDIRIVSEAALDAAMRPRLVLASKGDRDGLYRAWIERLDRACPGARRIARVSRAVVAGDRAMVYVSDVGRVGGLVLLERAQGAWRVCEYVVVWIV